MFGMERKQLFRLCHLCDCLNESETEILRCTNCGKGFLPINYFEKLRVRAQQQGTVDFEAMGSFPVNPLNGLIVFW
jgi:hypothetical protein